MARVVILNDVMKIVECEFHQKDRLAPSTIQDTFVEEWSRKLQCSIFCCSPMAELRSKVKAILFTSKRD